jgi:membrane protein DedA with SNARE-associated domain
MLGRAKGALGHRPTIVAQDRLRGHPTAGVVPLNPLDLIKLPYDGFNWLTDVVFIALFGLFERFGAPIVFVSALAEATIGLGLIFPGTILMFLGGAAASKGATELWMVFPLAVAGTILGDLISYAAGRWGGERLMSTRLGPSLRVGADMMRGRARWLIPFYHLHAMTRAVGPFGAGAIHMPFRVWAPLDFLGAVVANTVWVGAGYAFGATVLTDDGRLIEHPALRLGLAAVGVTWFLIVQHTYDKRMREMKEREDARNAAAHGMRVG